MKARDALANLRIVLARPSHPGNIGAAARAMKTMGCAHLLLVQPRHFPDPDATAMAAGADDVLANARVFSSLQAALADCVLAIGFSARRRDLSQPAATLREAAPGIVASAHAGPVALVFGNETSGLSNVELGHCQKLVTVPSNPVYGSLNLAAAVQVACYEVASAAAAFAPEGPRVRAPATNADLEKLFANLERVAIASGYLDPEKPGRFMERVRRLMARAQVEREEVKLLQGLLAACPASAAATPAAPSRKRSRPRSRKPA
ncbi:RNA methyltransferase [Usitatibacter palustris]|uniref:tRNA (cytidine/uridine-2'-O-)-methyltransferase TrmJ n=1 Tax=Usitatibacter palustris TaxID=2732487 RepID=A0A6M4H634_9PROT|nr:RNA methyltransferase [Usitatibacter palustris]QJR14398.1 tRNA (cytidine/uridine-2'-O-)-methyltransferase TrmJ [Usitatibacter palustris]